MSRKALILLLAGSAALIVVVGLALVISPPWFVPSDELGNSDRIKLLAEGSVRATIVQFVAGLLVVLGLAYTAAQVRISQETHFTDRYTKAIDQLGHEAPSVRMGAIFALKRLADNSAADRPVVLAVLIGYLKAHADRQPTTSSDTDTTSERTKLAPDVQTALTVLIGLHADAA